MSNIHKLIRNPINIVGSDGKYSTLKSLQYFIQENKEKVSTFTSPHLYDVRHRFWLKDKFIGIKELKDTLVKLGSIILKKGSLDKKDTTSDIPEEQTPTSLQKTSEAI